MIDQTQARRLLLERFPELEAEFEPEASELFHLDIAAFRRLTAAVIESGSSPEIKRHFASAAELLEQGDPFVKNAVAVSYLEHLEFLGKPGESAKRLLPRALEVTMIELDSYMSELLGEEWRRSKQRRNWPAV